MLHCVLPVVEHRCCFRGFIRIFTSVSQAAALAGKFGLSAAAIFLAL
jgi:hypothetical protein